MFERLKAMGRAVKRELVVYQLVLRHPGTPVSAQWLLWLAIGYLLMPFDLIPDFIPVLGHVDDLVIVPALIALAFWLTPKDVVDACRRQARGEIEPSETSGDS